MRIHEAEQLAALFRKRKYEWLIIDVQICKASGENYSLVVNPVFEEQQSFEEATDAEGFLFGLVKESTKSDLYFTRDEKGRLRVCDRKEWVSDGRNRAKTEKRIPAGRGIEAIIKFTGWAQALYNVDGNPRVWDLIFLKTATNEHFGTTMFSSPEAAGKFIDQYSRAGCPIPEDNFFEFRTSYQNSSEPDDRPEFMDLDFLVSGDDLFEAD
jgi:hypothetical protein